MKPTLSPAENPQQELFRTPLLAIINRDHSLVKLAEAVDWSQLENVFGEFYCDDNGRSGISTRLMVSLHYLKFTYDLSDEVVVSKWVENPYWQYLSGMKYFEHKVPIDPSSMSRWRTRIGSSGAEELLQATVQAGLKLKAIKKSQLKRINVDSTVQEKDIRFPTDARLYNRARERLVKAAAERDIPLRQNYNRVGPQTLLKYSRYSHAKQMKRARKCNRTLQTYLGRVIRDIERKSSFVDEDLQHFLTVSKRILSQKRYDKKKIYSVHEPHVECISKGKAHKRYEFGCKVSVATTSKGGWFVGSMALHGNPYDGHTLSSTLQQVTRLSPTQPDMVFVDRGYRGHDYQGDIKVFVDKVRRGRTSKSLWKWMKRRAAIEPSIGHLKSEHRMDRNRLRGRLGDQLNAILSAAGMNFSKLLRWLEKNFLFFPLLRHVLRFFGICKLDFCPMRPVGA